MAHIHSGNNHLLMALFWIVYGSGSLVVTYYAMRIAAYIREQQGEVRGKKT